MKIRIKFTKTGRMRFIGHLDFLRFFQKAVARSGILPVYTTGFNPHMILCFASPLGVGLESLGEYCDFEIAYKDPYATETDKSILRDLEIEESELCDTPSEEFIRNRLNSSMPEGVKVISVRRICEGHADNAMSLVHTADYKIDFTDCYADELLLENEWPDFIASPSIPYEKKIKVKNKNRRKQNTEEEFRSVDLRPFVLESKIQDGGLWIRCLCGSSANLKPELLVEAYCRRYRHVYDRFRLGITRLEMYAENGKSLEECGVSLTAQIEQITVK